MAVPVVVPVVELVVLPVFEPVVLPVFEPVVLPVFEPVVLPVFEPVDVDDGLQLPELESQHKPLWHLSPVMQPPIVSQ